MNAIISNGDYTASVPENALRQACIALLLQYLLLYISNLRIIFDYQNLLHRISLMLHFNHLCSVYILSGTVAIFCVPTFLVGSFLQAAV